MTNSVSLAAEVLLDLDANRVALENLTLGLDESTATGWIRIPDLAQEHIAFDLAFDALDADRYMGPPVEESESGDEPLDLPIEDMRVLDIDGRLSIGTLKASGATLSNVSLGLTAKDGLIQLSPFTANLYGGDYSGNIQLDVSGEKSKVSLNDTLNGVQLGDLFKDMSGETQLAGIGNFTINVTAAGNTTNEMMGTLTGDLSLNMDEGKYLGTDIWYEIRKAKAVVSREGPPEEPVDPYTDVTEFSGSARISNGVVNNQDFKAGAPYLRLSGKGIVNLVPETLDYQLIANIVGTPNFGGDEGLDVLEGIDIAIRLTGPMDSPDYKFEGSSLLSGSIDKQKEEFKEKTEEKKEDVREKIKDKLDSLKDKFNF
jgi:AsmA protein